VIKVTLQCAVAKCGQLAKLRHCLSVGPSVTFVTIGLLYQKSEIQQNCWVLNSSRHREIPTVIFHVWITVIDLWVV